MHDAGNIVFRQCEHHADRLQLGDDDDAGGIAGLDDVARIDQAQADAAGGRRGDVAIDQLQFLRIDRGLVDLDLRLVLAHQRVLRGQRLFLDRVLLVQHLVAHQVDLGVLQQGHVVRHRAFGLLQRDLVGARIDDGDQLVFLDDLPFGEQHFHQRAGHVGLDRDGG